MTEKEEMQDKAVEILEKRNIEKIHIPNRVFSKGFMTPKDLKSFPDIVFLYKGILYMREFGIKKNSHKDRKDDQLEKMKKWKEKDEL